MDSDRTYMESYQKINKTIDYLSNNTNKTVYIQLSIYDSKTNTDLKAVSFKGLTKMKANSKNDEEKEYIQKLIMKNTLSEVDIDRAKIDPILYETYIASIIEFLRNRKADIYNGIIIRAR